MNSGRENCSAIASASTMCVRVQKKHMLPTAPVAPRTRCIPSRRVRSGSIGWRMNSGSTKKNPINERKNRTSTLGMRAPSCLTSTAMTTSVNEPAETRNAPRATPSIALQRARHPVRRSSQLCRN